MDNRIIIIDGNSLINRAYYAMQNPMITREGIYTQGIFGFLNMLTKIKNEYPSGYIAVAFDSLHSDILNTANTRQAAKKCRRGLQCSFRC